jgi:hypothetical protein
MTGSATSAAAAIKAFFMGISIFREPSGMGRQLAGGDSRLKINSEQRRECT